MLHVGSGSLGLLLAPFGLAARKARGRHTRISWIYVGLVSVLAVSAVGLAALHWSRLWWLAAIAVATELAVASWRLAGDRAQVRAETVHGALRLALDLVGGAGEQDGTSSR